MKNKKNNVNKKKEIKKDNLIESKIEVKKNNSYLICLIGIIILLILVIILLLFYKKNDDSKCNAPVENVIEVIKEPDYQLINFQGFTFKMPLDWNFVSKEIDSVYSIANKDESLFINMESISIDYDLFIGDEYQRTFLETIQTSSNTKIINSKNMNDYYLFEGTYNDYNYMMVAVGNNENVILIKAQFLDKISYEKLKNNVIEFSISYK